MSAQRAGRRIDDARRVDVLKDGNPGVSDESVAFGLRRAREIFERRHNPIRLELSELQLAAIIAGAHHDGGGEAFKADLRARLEDMGIGEDVPINGADAVDFLNDLFVEIGGQQEPLNYGGTD